MPVEVFRKVPKGTSLKVMRAGKELNMVDKGILHLLVKLNKLSYVSTFASCEGHVGRKKMIKKIREPEKLLLLDADLTLRIDLSHPGGKRLAKELKRLSQEREWVSFQLFAGHEEGKGPKKAFHFKMGGRDLVNEWQVGEAGKVLERKKAFHEFWKKMEEIVNRHFEEARKKE